MESAKAQPLSPKIDRKSRKCSGQRTEKSRKNAAHPLWNGGKYAILSLMMRHRQAVRQGTLTPPS